MQSETKFSLRIFSDNWNFFFQTEFCLGLYLSHTEFCLGLNSSRTEFCLGLHTVVVFPMQSFNVSNVKADGVLTYYGDICNLTTPVQCTRYKQYVSQTMRVKDERLKNINFTSSYFTDAEFTVSGRRNMQCSISAYFVRFHEQY